MLFQINLLLLRVNHFFKIISSLHAFDACLVALFLSQMSLRVMKEQVGVRASFSMCIHGRRGHWDSIPVPLDWESSNTPTLQPLCCGCSPDMNISVANQKHTFVKSNTAQYVFL